MTTYVMFGEYSHGAIKEISADRSKAAEKIITDAGGKVEAGYALLGVADMILIVDFPGLEQAMKVSIELNKLLGISFTTAPAMSIDEFDRLFG
ncbi:MAG: GYD domain-containing protein [Chloroflexota bacterium]|nr:GYD domain-containing protein [Chloroflexota bacterium]